MGFRFSARTGWDTGESGFAAAIREARAAGRELIDLTVSNPTACGFDYDAEAILGPLGDAKAMTYDPDPRGMRVAREAVAAYYRGYATEVDSDDVVLTTSTSEGYGYLFRLLCDAGDDVLVAQPSYPLFDFLADLEDVRLVSYPLFYDFGWWIDFAELERRIGPRTKAIVVVHPNNPTGHATGAAERTRLEGICLRHGLALIVDEVFLDYPLEEIRLESFAAGPNPVLTFVLSGMSKIAGLPQMKVGWVVCRGPEKVRREAMARLEVVADTFLSMNAPVQLALPGWLAERTRIQRQILERVRGNLGMARAAGLEVLRVDAGWCAILRLPQRGEREMAERLLWEVDVVVHPGAFYGIGEAGRVVVSLLGPAEEFAVGVRRIVAFCGIRA
jgi:aspartate/methionine/tyrosine aminotransferase